MDEAQMIESNITNGQRSETVGRSVGQVVHDIMNLAELQAELFKQDASEIVGRLMMPFAIMAASLLLLVAALPICLIAIALGLMAAGLSGVVAFAIVAICSLMLVGILASWGWQRLRNTPPGFARSREELGCNLVWVKNAITNAATKPSNPAVDHGTHHRN
jgi:multidrug efflux pump subunit AcrB